MVMVVFLAGTSGLGACALTFDARTLGANTSMSAVPGNQPQGEEFRITKKAVFVFWGFAAATRPSLERILAGQLTGDAQVANLRIRVTSRVGDLIATALTLGLVVPRSVTYEGVIVRPPAAPAP
jgi:hypothetical protein